MKLAEVKTIADKISAQAQKLIERDGCLYPVFFSINKDEALKPVMIDLDGERKKNVLIGILEYYAAESEAMIVLIDSWVLETENDADIPESLENCKDACSAIVCVVYIKDASSLRRLVYEKKGVWYSFIDLGWSDVGPGEMMQSRLENPYWKKAHHGDTESTENKNIKIGGLSI